MSKKTTEGNLPKGVREDDILYEAPPTFGTIKQPAPEWVKVTALRRKKGKDDTLELPAWPIPKGSRKDFILGASRNELKHGKHFEATPGAMVEYDGQLYDCYQTAIYADGKAHPVLLTVPAA